MQHRIWTSSSPRFALSSDRLPNTKHRIWTLFSPKSAWSTGACFDISRFRSSIDSQHYHKSIVSLQSGLFSVHCRPQFIVDLTVKPKMPHSITYFDYSAWIGHRLPNADYNLATQTELSRLDQISLRNHSEYLALFKELHHDERLKERWGLYLRSPLENSPKSSALSQPHSD